MRFISTLLLVNLLIINALATPNPKVQFIRNDGQWESSIRFRAEIPGGFLLVKNTGLQYVFIDYSPLHPGMSQDKNARQKPINGHSVEMQFVAGNPQPTIQTNQESEAKYNYFKGNDPTKWAKNVPVFEEIIIKDIYPDIDFRLYGIDQSLKYEYLAKPNADVAKIKMKYLGADSLSLDNQAFTIKTSLNIFKEFQPYSFQKIAGQEKAVKSNFRLQHNEIQFEFPENYNKTQSLTIDPQLVFSTYSGSHSDNWGNTATYDADGNLYAGSSVFGSDFPVTVGAFQVNQGGGSATATTTINGVTDVGIMKFSPDGSKLLYATFLGGGASEVAYSLVVNSKGQLVVFGVTSSKNYPVTANALQNTFGGGQIISSTTQIGFTNGTDIFVTVLSKTGDALIGSTYLGGTRNDGFNDTSTLDLRNYGDEFRGEVNVDADDNIYLASITNSSDFPLKNASQTTKGGIAVSYDAIACKLNSTASALLWSTFLGGDGFDAAYSVKVAKSGSIYVCGATTSTNLATKDGSLNKILTGKADGFIAKFTNNTVEQITYLGTKTDDIADFLDLDKQGNVYVYGITSGTYPVSDGVYRNDKSGQFIHCLDKNLSQTVFSTVVGAGTGFNELVPTAFLVNDCGSIYLAGWGGKVNVNDLINLNSTTKNMPITSDAIQKTTTGSNFYIMILESGAKSLLYSTYFGASAPTPPEGEAGDHLDGGTCRFDKNGIIYHAACACKSRQGVAVATFPATATAYQKTSGNNTNNNCNLAAFKINLDTLQAKFDITDGRIIVNNICAPAKVDFTDASTGAKTYEWQVDGVVLSRQQNPTQVPFNIPGTYVVKLKIYNKISCKTVDSTQKVLVVKGFTAKVSADTTICSSIPVQLKADGGSTYSWTPVDFLNNSKIASPIATVKNTTKYTVVISKDGCDVSKDVTIKVDDTKADFQVSQGAEVCAGQTVQLSASGNATNFTWSIPASKDTVAKSIIVKPLQSTTYTISATYPDGCKPQKTVTLTVDTSFQPVFDVAILQDCNKPLQLLFTNATKNADKEVWTMGNGESLTTLVPENYKYSKSGDYSITLTAYNKAGCKLTATKLVVIPDNDGKVPNVITPNGDGKNDTFVFGYKNATLMIYNRWGKLIFESKNYQNDWGKGIETGDYFYVLTTTLGTECKGIIQVIN